MYYAQGDYYKGDYYRGDPGLFSGIGRALKGAVRVVGGAALGFVTGGGVKGAIGGAIAGTGRAISAGTTEETLAAGGSESAYTPAMRARHNELVARGGGGGLVPRGAAMGAATSGLGAGGLMLPGAAGMRVRRMHPNKTTYVTRGGGTSRWPPGLAIHPKGTELVPSRRMNVVNPRALRRASRRIRGAVKILRRIIRDSSHVRGRGAVHRVRRAKR